MYLKFAVAALLALTGLPGTADQAPQGVDQVATRTPTRAGAATDAPSDGATLKQVDVVVPPVATSGTVATPDPAATPADAVVADQLVAPKRLESDVVAAKGFQTVGVTWPEGADVGDLGAQVRSRTGGAWSAWVDLTPGDDSPDANTADAAHAVRGGTDPVWVGNADAVQLAFAATPEGGPDGMRLALVDSSTKPASDGIVGTSTTGEATIRTAALTTGMLKTSSAPRVISRGEWGAPAQVCRPDVASNLVGAVLHHTAGTNSYSTVAEAEAQIRGDAAYHINGRGWCDIGYNFIVDKWGNIYEGRANSMNQAVIGVHAGGFNTGTLGVAMLGTYDAVPSGPTQLGVGTIIGWRLKAYGVNPQGSMVYYTGSGENSRFANQNVGLPRVLGHRDVAYTACPGNGGYAALANIRAVAASIAYNTAPPNPLAIGQVDTIGANATSITVTGWALDPDTNNPIGVHVYIDGGGHAFTADLSRPDVATVYGHGDRHGFAITIPATTGNHTVCVYAINTPAGDNTTLRCAGVTVASALPIGQVDTINAAANGINLAGWALDPDTNDPIAVHIYIDGGGHAITANLSRPDVANAFGHGDRHGFSTTIPMAPGNHNVCVYAINTPAGDNPVLRCANVPVTNAAPFGHIDSLSAASNGINVSGWALDPNTSDPVAVHIYVDGVGRALSADLSRPDIANAFHNGDRHGFSTTIFIGPGNHTVCVYAINTPAADNATLGCRTVTVVNAPPIGHIDSIGAAGGAINVAGWALDPNTNDPIAVHIYVDGVGRALTANLSRPDVANAFGYGDRHGFSTSIPARAGSHNVCVYAINVPAADNVSLGCRTVTVG